MSPFSFFRQTPAPPVPQSTVSVQITRNVEIYHSSSSRVTKLRRRSAHDLSVKQQLPDVFTPRLPPELWLQILLCAARDEGEVTIMGTHYTHSHSFFQVVPAHAHLSERLARYNSWLKWKASLTTVCSLFNAVAQEVLYEDVWVTASKDGRRLAERLGGLADTRVARISSAIEQRQVQKPWWCCFVGSKTKTKHNASFHLSFEHRSSHHGPSHDLQRPDPGRFIRRLRVETSAMDQCSPHDLLLILQHCPGLLVFEDCRSIRRPMHPLIITSSDVVPFDIDPHVIGDRAPDSVPMPLLTTDILAHTILSRPLKRVTWTNYAHDGGDLDRGVRVYVQFLGPLLKKFGSNLEVLEIIASAASMSMGSSESEGSWAVTRPAGQSKLQQESVITRQFNGLFSPELSNWSITLPSLESLKVTLDNATFAALASWSMPSLRNLSVISPDFRFGLEGFRRFLEVHGDRIQQLELGHTNGDLEEFWITEQSGEFRPRSRIRLDVWCPNLKEFICNADAEWNWESPDWIAPHILLPAHPGLECIGVRGLEKRFVNDAAEFMRTGSEDEYPYFMLLQQFSSMLRAEAFPSLRCVRDLSWQSDRIRRTGKLRLGSSTSADPGRPSLAMQLVVSPSFPFLHPARLLSSGPPRVGNRGRKNFSSHVLRFWDEALEKCRGRGVSVENYLGVAVTSHHSRDTPVIEE